MSKKELEILLPEETLKLSSGELLTISKVPFGKLRLFSDAVGNLLKKIQESGISTDTLDYQKIFDIAFEEVINIMMLILNKDRKWFDTISIEDGLAILNVIVRQNFSENAKKNLALLLKQMKSLLQTQSKS